MNAPIDWLLAGEPYIQYRTRRDLLDQPEQDPAVQAARRAMLAERQVQELLAELGGWPGTVIASHKSAGQPFHKLTCGRNRRFRSPASIRRGPLSAAAADR